MAKLVTNSSYTIEINFELFKLKDLLKLWNQCPGSVVPLVMFLIQICLDICCISDMKVFGFIYFYCFFIQIYLCAKKWRSEQAPINKKKK